MLASLCWSFTASADDSIPPLLKQSKILACAKTESVARSALSTMWDIEDSEKEFPNESMQSGDGSTLHAATLDIVLKSMLGASDRFPSLRNQVERTLLKWNYCDVFQEGVFYDLERTSTGFKRVRAAEASPEKWQGFSALGFLGETDNRFVPQILDLDQNSLRSDYEWLFHRIYRQQCFPHPDTSELFDISEIRLKENIVEGAPDASSEYPHAWDPECLYPRAAPELNTNVKIVDVPLLVPNIMSTLNIVPVPKLVPGLNTKVELMPVEQLVPGLKTQVKLLPVPQLVPSLGTQLKLLPVPQLVPNLSTQLQLLPVAQAVPELLTQLKLIQQPLEIPKLVSLVEIQEMPQLVPALATSVDLQPVPITIPLLNSKLLIEKLAVPVPKLLTKVFIDKPKYVAPKKVVQKAPVKYVGNHNTNNQGYYPQTVVQQPRVVQQQRVVQQPVVQRVPVTQVVTQPNLVVNKNASLIERLLGGISGGSNVLIVDKIQLTVNEYNGTVETAISSSDIGTTVASTVSQSEAVKQILNALPVKSQQHVTTANKTPVKTKAVVKKKAVKQSPGYLKVPYLQTMLLVSEASSARASKPVKKVKKASKNSKASKRKPRKKKKQTRSSSVFTYSPYPKGQAPKSEKSIEQLLREYQQYEEDRKLGRLPKRKKKVNRRGNIQEKYKPDTRLRDVPPLDTELWVEEVTTSYDPVKVPSLKSKVKVYSKYSAKPLKVPALSTMIIQQLTGSTSDSKRSDESFEFSNDYFSDEVFEDTQVRSEAGGSFEFSQDRLKDEVFENTLISGKKNKAQGKPQKKTKKATKNKKAIKVKPKKKTIGLAGNVYYKNTLKTGAKAIGGSINRKLIKDSYWFARVGWNYNLEEVDDPFSYSWGIGYSDWHPGTFSAQLNNWGPIKPGEGLALEKAVANFGYSVKSDFLKKHKLSLSGAINVPVEGNSSAVANLRWSPVKNWYVNASVSQPLEGDGTPKWTYGFGYSDWRPNKINLQYSNYGPNEIPYHNFEENGTWSLSYNWKF